MKQKIKRKLKRDKPHQTRPFYLHNEDIPKLEPVPERSKWIAVTIMVVIVVGIVWFLCSCEGFKESNEASGLGGKKYHEAVHIPSAADGP